MTDITVVNKGKEMLEKFGPWLGLPIGYAIGTFVNVPWKLNEYLKTSGVLDAIGKYVPIKNQFQVSALITAAIFVAVGVAVHKMMHGAIGKFVAFTLYGVAIHAFVAVLSGYSPAAVA
jgi:hypothetical protein